MCIILETLERKYFDKMLWFWDETMSQLKYSNEGMFNSQILVT